MRMPYPYILWCAGSFSAVSFSGGFGEDRASEHRALRVRIEDMYHNALHHASGSAEGRARSEPELRQLIVQALRASGIAVEEQVVCQAGAADIVTVRRDAVIEIKLALTRKAIQWAVGQVLLYRAAINPAARAIVVGYATSET